MKLCNLKATETFSNKIISKVNNQDENYSKRGFKDALDKISFEGVKYLVKFFLVKEKGLEVTF